MVSESGQPIAARASHPFRKTQNPKFKCATCGPVRSGLQKTPPDKPRTSVGSAESDTLIPHQAKDTRRRLCAWPRPSATSWPRISRPVERGAESAGTSAVLPWTSRSGPPPLPLPSSPCLTWRWGTDARDACKPGHTALTKQQRGSCDFFASHLPQKPPASQPRSSHPHPCSS